MADEAEVCPSSSASLCAWGWTCVVGLGPAEEAVTAMRGLVCRRLSLKDGGGLLLTGFFDRKAVFGDSGDPSMAEFL